MSTRLKLIVLVLFTSLAGASTVFINNLMMTPVQRIETEQKVLDQLSYDFIEYIGQVNRLDSDIFVDQLNIVMEKKRKLDNSFKQIESLTFLPSINDTIRSSLETIFLFSNFLEKKQNTLEAEIESVIAIANQILGPNSRFSIYQLAWGSDIDDETYEEMKERVFFFTNATISLNNNANNILSQLNEQYDVIAEEIQKYQNRAQSIISIIQLLVVIIPLILALVIANVLAGRIRRIDIGISQMKQGNLADRINVKGSDEMGRLSSNVNDFTDALSRSLLKIKKTSRTNLSLKDMLVSSVYRVSETTELVNKSAQSISSGIGELDKTVRVTNNAVSTVEKHLLHLEEILNEQVSMIEETSASITEMITSIANVSDITKRKKAALSTLVNFSTEGGSKLMETNLVISKVHDNIEVIHDTVTIIDDIADRTNLLAMNAAIEAAHAGDAGRGFAVVAEEIRKLAEATSQNSKLIGGIMRGIIENIEAAVSVGKDTGEVFNRIDKEVNETSESFDEIAENMDELRVGGTQIIEAMSRLNDISVEVKDGDLTMHEATGQNKKAIENVESISQVIAERVKEIIQALSTLIKEMEAVTQVTQRSDDISKALESEVAMFQIDDDLENSL